MDKFIHPVKGLDPVADAFTVTAVSDVINLENIIEGVFIIYKGVGTTGTSTITLEACDDVTPTTTSAIAFEYQANTTGDTYGAVTAATTAGFTTTAGSSQIYVVYVHAAKLAASGYGYVRLKATEVVDAAVLGGIIFIPTKLRHEQAVPGSRIV